MIARILGHDHGARDRACAIGMLLQCRIPKILRVVLPAGRKADGGSAGIPREGERESHFELAAIRRAALALELQGLRDRDPGGAEIARVSVGITAFQYQEGEPLLFLEKNAVEGAEQRREAILAKLLGLRDRQQLDEESGQLDDLVVGAPGVPVACPDREAEPSIEGRRPVEVANRMLGVSTELL